MSTDDITPSSSMPNPTGSTNIFTLAADGSRTLLPTLRSNPSLASSQDSTGYSLLHALASYNHLSLLRTVATEFSIPPNLTDTDSETALFVVETVAAAQLLIEELHLDWRLRNADGQTAEEKIRSEGDYVAVADYLGEVRRQETGERDVGGARPPSLPPGVKMQVGTMEPEQAEELPEPDPEFRRRIEELAAREDFGGEGGQAELRRLVEDAVRGVGERDVRRRTD